MVAVEADDFVFDALLLTTGHESAREAAGGEAMHRVLPELLRFIGARPIVGYYVDFDVAMLDKYVLPFIEARLPNRRIEVSSLYYALKHRHAPPGTVHTCAPPRSSPT